MGFGLVCTELAYEVNITEIVCRALDQACEVVEIFSFAACALGSVGSACKAVGRACCAMNVCVCQVCAIRAC